MQACSRVVWDLIVIKSNSSMRDCTVLRRTPDQGREGRLRCRGNGEDVVNNVISL